MWKLFHAGINPLDISPTMYPAWLSKIFRIFTACREMDLEEDQSRRELEAERKANAGPKHPGGR